MITQIKTFILREQNVEEILWEKKSSYEGEKKRKLMYTGRRKDPVLKKFCMLFHQHTSLNDSFWAESPNLVHKCFFLLSLQVPDMIPTWFIA